MSVNRSHSSPTALRRQMQIEDCLYENLLHTNWQSISVADICRQVGISRKAYYNYYRDKYDCFASYVDRLLRECILYVTRNLPDNPTKLDTAVVMLDYWKDKKDFLDVVIRNNLLYTLMTRSIEYAVIEDRNILDQLSTPEVESDSDIVACFTSIQMTLILCWYGRDFDTPTEEMAKKFLRLLHKPLVPGPETI